MARTKKQLSVGNPISEHLSIGLLAKRYPSDLIDEVLKDSERKEQRVRDLPSRLVVYYVVAMALFMSVSTREVMRCLVESLRWLSWAGNEMMRVVCKGAISRARSRVGAEPLRLLWERTAKPLASSSTPQAFYRNHRLVSIDGSTLDIADTKENAAHFGRPSASRGSSAFPKLRFCALVETGTHGIFAAAMGPYERSEASMASELIEHLKSGMLCLADRGFFSYQLWKKAADSGAALLWRVKKNLLLPVEEELEDGSYLSSIYPSAKARRHGVQAIKVRVIEYRTEDDAATQEPYRLITTLLDCESAPALELAALYHERWEIEGVFDELKTHTRGAQMLLRSRKPKLVEQEFYGLLLAHSLVRELMLEAAITRERDPDDCSFIHTIRLIRRKLAAMPDFFPSGPEANSRYVPA